MVKGWWIPLLGLKILVVALLTIGDGPLRIAFLRTRPQRSAKSRIIEFLRGLVRRNATGNEQVHLSSAENGGNLAARLK